MPKTKNKLVKITSENKLHNKSDNPALEARLSKILDLLYSFYDQEINMSLERVKRFLKQLGNPHLKLPPVVHVAGTNGKGSTIAILRSLLEASDKSCHVMTSPHLVHPTERLRLAGELISTENLIDVLEECLAVNRTEPITFFEIFCAASFLAMSRMNADYVLLETGMGGRLDATNVVPDPICTIITTISKDHEKFLGHTLPKIAYEKAMIMKRDVPCVIGRQTHQAIDTGINNVFQEVSSSLSPVAKLFRYGKNWDIRVQNDMVHFSWQDESVVTSHPNLCGPHQVYNAGAALAAFRIITNKPLDSKLLSPENPQNPLLTIQWSGRLQQLNNEPICKRAKPGQELWIDGGHNDSAGVALAKQAKIWQAQDDKPLHLIVAMVDRKNPSDFLSPLLPYTESLTVTSIKNEASSFDSKKLYEFVKPLGFKNLYLEKTPEEAIENINDPNARILITGSLYFLGNILT